MKTPGPSFHELNSPFSASGFSYVKEAPWLRQGSSLGYAKELSSLVTPRKFNQGFPHRVKSSQLRQEV